MNSTKNDSLETPSPCSLTVRVYSSDYLFFKLLNSTYLRLLVGPGILLNTLCLIVLSRPRLSSKSTTIVFLRFLAIFDILAITLKYIRAELNYQSLQKHRSIILLTPWLCKALYVFMNASISMAMWTIVLMSVDKAVAVSYPLKSSIWVTQKRAFYICCLTSVVLLLANLPFISLSDVISSRTNGQKYCGLIKDSLMVDIITASILPIGLITAANIVIAVILHRVSRTSFDWEASEDNKDVRCPKFSRLSHKRQSITLRYQSSPNSSTSTDTSQAAKRRTSAQVTRMLLAVTLSLIIFNIPNTIIFVFTKIYDIRGLLFGRSCFEVSDHDIKLYKIGFYSSVIQDILSDLTHTVNFFLYCLAGKKFRRIFINEVQYFLFQIPILKQRQRRFTRNGSLINPELTNASVINWNQRRISLRTALLESKKSVNAVFNGTTSQSTLCDESYKLTIKGNYRYHKEQVIRTYSTIK